MSQSSLYFDLYASPTCTHSNFQNWCHGKRRGCKLISIFGPLDFEHQTGLDIEIRLFVTQEGLIKDNIILMIQYGVNVNHKKCYQWFRTAASGLSPGWK